MTDKKRKIWFDWKSIAIIYLCEIFRWLNRRIVSLDLDYVQYGSVEWYYQQKTDEYRKKLHREMNSHCARCRMDVWWYYGLPYRHHSEERIVLIGRENNSFFEINFDNNHNDLFDCILKRNGFSNVWGRCLVYRYDWREIEFQSLLNSIHYFLVDHDLLLSVNNDTNHWMFSLDIHRLMRWSNEQEEDYKEEIATYIMKHISFSRKILSTSDTWWTLAVSI